MALQFSKLKFVGTKSTSNIALESVEPTPSSLRGKFHTAHVTCEVSWDTACLSSLCNTSQHSGTSTFSKTESHPIRSERDLMQHLVQAPHFPGKKTEFQRGGERDPKPTAC